MRCFICDHNLTDEEVLWNRNHQDWEPCTECKEIVRQVFNEIGDPEEPVEIELDDGVEYPGEEETYV